MRVYNRLEEVSDWIHTSLGAPLLEMPLNSSQIEDRIQESIDYAGLFMGGVANEEQFVILRTLPEGIVDRNNPDAEVQLEEGNCTTAAGALSAACFIRYKAEYQLPRNVVSVMDILGGGSIARTGAGQGAIDDDASIMQTTAYGAGVGAVASLGGIGGGGVGGFGLFLPQSTPGIGMFSQFGTRGGVRPSGSGLDLISYYQGMQYLEMMNQMFTVKTRVQFMEQTRRVRLSPPPGDGLIMLQVMAKVPDKWMYENLWVRRYALALCKIQVGMNLRMFKGASLPGAVQLNYEDYLNEGREEKKELEQELADNKYGEPPSFFFG